MRSGQLIRTRRVDRGRRRAAGSDPLLLEGTDVELKMCAVLWDAGFWDEDRTWDFVEEYLGTFALYKWILPPTTEDVLHEAQRRIGRAAEARSCGKEGCPVAYSRATSSSRLERVFPLFVLQF